MFERSVGFVWWSAEMFRKSPFSAALNFDAYVPTRAFAGKSALYADGIFNASLRLILGSAGAWLHRGEYAV